MAVAAGNSRMNLPDYALVDYKDGVVAQYSASLMAVSEFGSGRADLKVISFSVDHPETACLDGSQSRPTQIEPGSLHNHALFIILLSCSVQHLQP